MSVEVVWNYIVFALLHTFIGTENSRHFHDQSDAKVKLITTWSPAFSRALDNLVVFTLSSHWLLKYYPSSDWLL